ncbi:MAG: hypothetical protein R3330_00335 [Saprospiraceae bacterium]|nr:hypothetical protein [Saprospiraceae bacterium]
MSLICTVVSAQAQLSLTLNLNHQRADTVYLDEPVIVSLTISNPVAEYALAQNRDIDRYLVRLEDSLRMGVIDEAAFNLEKDSLLADKFDVTTYRLGDGRYAWHQMLEIHASPRGDQESNWSLLACNDLTPILQLTGTDRVYVDFTLSGNPRPGVYPITVSLDSTYSNACLLTVLPGRLPATGSLEIPFLLELAERMLDCGDTAEAIRYCDQAIRAQPNSIGAHIIKSDALAGSGELQQALSGYRRALTLFEQKYPDAHQLPAHLLGQIAWLEEQLRQ